MPPVFNDPWLPPAPVISYSQNHNHIDVHVDAQHSDRFFCVCAVCSSGGIHAFTPYGYDFRQEVTQEDNVISPMTVLPPAVFPHLVFPQLVRSGNNPAPNLPVATEQFHPSVYPELHEIQGRIDATRQQLADLVARKAELLALLEQREVTQRMTMVVGPQAGGFVAEETSSGNGSNKSNDSDDPGCSGSIVPAMQEHAEDSQIISANTAAPISGWLETHPVPWDELTSVLTHCLKRSRASTSDSHQSTTGSIYSSSRTLLDTCVENNAGKQNQTNDSQHKRQRRGRSD